MHASAALACESRLLSVGACNMQSQQEPNDLPPSEPPAEAELKRSIRELLDVLPKDILDELNSGVVDLKDPAFLDGLMDHVSRLSLANPRSGQRILGKIIKVKKLITRSLRESDPQVAVSSTVTRRLNKSSGRTGCFQRNSSRPGEATLDSGDRKLVAKSRIISEAVCQPLAISPPNRPLAAAPGSVCIACGS